MTISLIARRAVVYHGRTRHPGDRFDAVPVDALVLTSSLAVTFATGREAQVASSPPSETPATSAETDTPTEHRSRRRHRRRDLQAEP